MRSFFMHQNTKLTEPLRREVFRRWKNDRISMRGLARDYHVDKRVIQRVIERGKDGDFEVRNSTNHRFLKPNDNKANRKRAVVAK